MVTGEKEKERKKSKKEQKEAVGYNEEEAKKKT